LGTTVTTSTGIFFWRGRDVGKSVIPFPVGSEDYARAEDQRQRALFAWADALLQQLGLDVEIAQAQTLDALRRIKCDFKDSRIDIAIQDALHPAAGSRAECFLGLREGALKRILQSRFNDLKKDREKELGQGSGGQSQNQSSSPAWAAGLKTDADGGIRPTLNNLILFLRKHPAWLGTFGFNNFTGRVVIRKPEPHWDNELVDAVLADHHETYVRAWFQDQDIAANKGDVGRALQQAARFSGFHPVRDLFESLKWDGEKRADTLLPTYFHTEDTEYTRAIGVRWLISGVARIYKPGCQADHMLVLEGPEGRRSSQALRALAIRDEWFSDRISNLHSKDAQIETAGVFIFELGEMDAMFKVSPSTFKNFISRRYEDYRPPHGTHKIYRPRQCIFSGTTNLRAYLKMATYGARRLWPAWCPSIDLEALIRDVPQLWAEAVVRFKAGDIWWLSSELEKLALAEQALRYKPDPRREAVVDYVGDREEVTVADIIEHGLGLKPNTAADASAWRSAETWVPPILVDLSFRVVRGRDGNKRSKIYSRKIDLKRGSVPSCPRS
jgi:predicted P-loop ATPase